MRKQWQVDELMMNEERAEYFDKKIKGVFALLPEVTYPWTVSCLEYGIAR